MSMKNWRPSLLILSLTWVGCLDASNGVLAYKDRLAPTVLSTNPASGAMIARTATISITFSEAMDERTLGAGIQLSKAGTPVPLVLGVPPPDQLPQTSENVDLPYPVSASPVAGSFESSIGSALDYLLLLNTLLTDQAGNALAAPVEIRFSVM